MTTSVPVQSRKRLLAAAWFAVFGFLAASLFFLRPDTKLPALCLYVLLPTVAASIAGCIWGGAILDRDATRDAAHSMLRGAGVTGGAFLIFAVLFSLALPLAERGWAVKQAGGILVATLTLGLLMVGPLIIVAGILGGFTLYMLGRRALIERDGQVSNHPNI